MAKFCLSYSILQDIHLEDLHCPGNIGPGPYYPVDDQCTGSYYYCDSDFIAHELVGLCCDFTVTLDKLQLTKTISRRSIIVFYKALPWGSSLRSSITNMYRFKQRFL